MSSLLVHSPHGLNSLGPARSTWVALGGSEYGELLPLVSVLLSTEIESKIPKRVQKQKAGSFTVSDKS